MGETETDQNSEDELQELGAKFREQLDNYEIELRENDKKEARSTARWMGWTVLLAAVAKFIVLLPMILVFVALDPIKAVVLSLLLLGGPTLGLLIGVGFIRGKIWSFWLLYFTFFISMWTISATGSGDTLLPLIKQLLGARPEVTIYVYAADLVFGIYMASLHVRYFHPADAKISQLALKRGLIGFFVVVTLFNGWRLRSETINTQLPNASEAPAAKEVFASIDSQGPIEVYYHNLFSVKNGRLLVASGTASREDVLKMATEQDLTAVPEESRAKLIRLVDVFKLETTRFPTEFGDGDLFYTGRLNDDPRANIQLCHRSSDGMFTLQIVGMKQPDAK